MDFLPDVSHIPALKYLYFPAAWQAVLWRNWGLIPAKRIAAVLKTDETIIREAAGQLGLNAFIKANPDWVKRGYLTIIRENWHLCSFEQITSLLDISGESLAFILKEDDFLWHKMGELKPAVEEPRYSVLTDEQAQRTTEIRNYLNNVLPENNTIRDNAFEFAEVFNRPLLFDEKDKIIKDIIRTDKLRTVYSYFALYGDPLLNPELDPFPEALLAEYAKAGVKGVWMQGLLYQLTEFPFDPGISAGYEIRQKNLKDLVKRASEYDIGIYLYINEPRAMNSLFFEKYPGIKGIREGDYFSMCTSCPEVKEYLEEAMFRLFSEVEGLAGFITITMSENLTNCISRTGADGDCPRCREREPEEIIAEVNNLLTRGMHRANPNARAIVWNWAWGEWADKVPQYLTENQIVQCTSEERMPTNIGGIKGHVIDYTMSLCGPGPKAKKIWESAGAAGLETSAKVQFNNTWELSAVPWLPVFDKVAVHVKNLKQAGIKHLQMSWTLGGYPSPNLKLAACLMDGKGDTASFLREWLGEELGKAADSAQHILSEAFSEFPFHIGTVYTGPMNYGPMTPFFIEPTGRKATMIGFPYDDLDTWRSIYPRDIFANQFRELVLKWRKGYELMKPHLGKSVDFDEIARMAGAALCHFESSYNQISFVMARDAGNITEMLHLIRSEHDNVKNTIKLRSIDSRIGYEASNHYYYSIQDLLEKLVNLKYVENNLLQSYNK